MEGSFVRYIEINASYKENIKENWKTSDIASFISRLQDDIKEYKGTGNTRYEIIAQNCIPYFDIEKIPTDDENKMIYTIADELISKLSDCSKTRFTRYCITYNSHSMNHSGRSYHVYFPEFATRKDEMKKFVNWYIDHKFTGHEYIDSSVYSKDRLFRLPYQRGVINGDHSVEDNERKQDYHRIIYGFDNAADYIVSNTKDKQTVFFVTIPYKYVGIKSVNTISGPYNATVKKLDKVCDLLTTVITDNKGIPHIDDKECYTKALALKELLFDEDVKNKYNKLLTEFIDYYNEHKSYDNFRLETRAINIILRIIETKI